MKPQITVMLVDDHAVVRYGYRMFLAQTGHIDVVCEAETGEAACQLYPEHQPRVVVMDLSLPGIGGLAAARHIIARDARARILFFSIHNESTYVARAMETGAKGYISKSCAPEILIEAVIAVARGRHYLEADIARRLALQSLTPAEGLSAVDALSAREFDVFCLLARGLTTREVAEELRLGYKTAANYATIIKGKLGVQTTADMVRIAYQHGLLKP